MNAALEDEVRARIDSGDLEAAATAAIKGYGPEVLAFLTAILGNAVDADEAFALTCTNLWSGLPKFEWRSTLRTWLYTVARRAASRQREGPGRRAKHDVGLSELDDVAAQVRSATQPFLRTDVKDAFAAVGDGLDPEDRALLVLRVDRAMDWKDIARVLFPEDAERSAQDLTRLTARLRKRFQAVKEEIRARAKDAGIL